MDTDDIFDPIPDPPPENAGKDSYEDPFEKDPLPVKKESRTILYSDEDFGLTSPVEIEEEIPSIEFIDSLPGVPSGLPEALDPVERGKMKAVTLRDLNDDVKMYTNEIKEKQDAELEANNWVATQIVYDMDVVRVFGQFGATHEEMAAYFGVDHSTVGKHMNDEESDFYKVYHKAKSLLHLSLRQMQIKGALAGSERLLIHLGKNFLGQGEEASAPKQIEKDLVRSGNKRRNRITTLTQKIEEFDVEE